jgi:hypothetical protein
MVGRDGLGSAGDEVVTRCMNRRHISVHKLRLLKKS